MITKMTGITLGILATLAIALPAMAEETNGSTTSTTASTATATEVTPATAETPAVATTSRTDTVTYTNRERDRGPHVKGGAGLNVFGAAGSNDSSKLGLGGRLEFMFPAGAGGVALGASYTQYFGGSGDNLQKTAVRPLLGEIGFAFAPVTGFEIRPMVGIGYAFVNTSSTGNTSNNANGSTATASVAASGLDVAPGAKFSFVQPGGGVEVYAMPKWHFLKDANDFFGLEVGAGARF